MEKGGTGPLFVASLAWRTIFCSGHFWADMVLSIKSPFKCKLNLNINLLSIWGFKVLKTDTDIQRYPRQTYK